MNSGLGKAPEAGSEPDWQSAKDYAALFGVAGPVLAWEWLRRTDLYRAHWECFLHGKGCGPQKARIFGLERFENPEISAPTARPVWSASIDPTVIQARISDPAAKQDDRIDLLRWSQRVSVAIDEVGDEHVLITDGANALRIDLMEGSLIGCPSSLTYFLEGITGLPAPISTLTRLILFQRTGRIGPGFPYTRKSYEKWILELRVADSLRAGASQQDIATTLFGHLRGPGRWRVGSNSLRLRVQRLVQRARYRLERPLDPKWFHPRRPSGASGGPPRNAFDRDSLS